MLQYLTVSSCKGVGEGLPQALCTGSLAVIFPRVAEADPPWDIPWKAWQPPPYTDIQFLEFYETE